MPSLSAGKGLVAAGEFAGDDRWAQLAFGQIVGGIDTGMIQEDQKMVDEILKSMT